MYIIEKTQLGIIKEPLIKPFGFKGANLTQLWHVVVKITLSNGVSGMGVAVQSVLWSDAICFSSYSEEDSNEKMLEITKAALSILEKQEFKTPPEMIKNLIPQLLKLASKNQNRHDVPQTFVLNSLVAVDFALWQIWDKLYSNGTFKGLKDTFAPKLKQSADVLANIPLITYKTSADEITQLLQNGTYLLKVKIGSDPNANSDTEEMLNWDINRLKQIHEIAKNYNSDYTDSGNILYYLDANGRYPNKDVLLRFLDAADKMGALSQIAVFEEPLSDNKKYNLKDLPVIFAADESVHSEEDVVRAIDEYGFKAIACKPIAKTLSITLSMINIALSKNAYCFCADLTVPPVMLDWNMSVAASLPYLKGLKTGIVESNGAQNYTNWKEQESKCPQPDASYRKSENGRFNIGDNFTDKNILFHELLGYNSALK